jgi:hypothetical protein
MPSEGTGSEERGHSTYGAQPAEARQLGADAGERDRGAVSASVSAAAGPRDGSDQIGGQRVVRVSYGIRVNDSVRGVLPSPRHHATPRHAQRAPGARRPVPGPVRWERGFSAPKPCPNVHTSPWRPVPWVKRPAAAIAASLLAVNTVDASVPRRRECGYRSITVRPAPGVVVRAPAPAAGLAHPVEDAVGLRRGTRMSSRRHSRGEAFMDPTRFYRLARTLCLAASRRGALAALLGSGLAGTLGLTQARRNASARNASRARPGRVGPRSRPKPSTASALAPAPT